MSGKYTIEDIARLAGVSRGTVSRVLNQHPAVSDETRTRVLAVIEQFDYRPNFSARHMRTDHSNLIGFVADEVITTPYAVDMIRGAQDKLREEGKVMLILSAGYERDTTEAFIQLLLERRVEGIIYAAMYHHAVELPTFNSQVPLVMANCYSPDGLYPSVVPDEFSGGYAATTHLLAAGHRRIGFINLGDPHLDSRPPPLDAAMGRLAGYKQALADYGLPYDEALVCYTPNNSKANYQLTLHIMSQTPTPTAIFCGTDYTAMGCYAALAELGFKIPRDVAVVGFDNRFDIVEGLRPTLTSVQLPHYEMGYQAVEYLLQPDVLEIPAQRYQLRCPLMPRQSA